MMMMMNLIDSVMLLMMAVVTSLMVFADYRLSVIVVVDDYYEKIDSNCYCCLYRHYCQFVV